MTKRFLMVILTMVITASALIGCSSKEEKKTTVNVNEETVVDVETEETEETEEREEP